MTRFLTTFTHAIMCLLFASASYALDVSIKPISKGPFGASNSLFLSGTVELGDTEKVWKAIQSLDLKEPGTSLHVVVDSPGGALTEGLKIGRLLDKLPTLFPITVTSDVGKQADQLTLTGDCASACVFIYLGGSYRFLNSGSRLGVHQFYFGNGGDVNSEQATSISQMLAAEIAEYLRSVRVDPSFFALMTQTREVVWVDREQLEKMRVINGYIYDQTSEYKNANGLFYLLLWQQSYFGENKIAAMCENGQMQFMAFLQPPDLSKVPVRWHELTVVVDGDEFEPAWREKPVASGRFERAAFSLNSNQLERFLASRSVGARMMVPGAGVFFGFEMDVPDGKLRDTITGCKAKAHQSAAASSSMSRLPGYDLTGGDLFPSGVKDTSLEDCEAVCLREPACLGVSYVSKSRWCWPKQNLSSPARAEGIISSFKQ